VTADDPYAIVLTPPAVRAIQTRLPEVVAATVVEFLTGALIEISRGIGKPLRGDLSGIQAAGRGTYRVLYRINEDDHEVVVVRVDHRSGAYRTS